MLLQSANERVLADRKASKGTVTYGGHCPPLRALQDLPTTLSTPAGDHWQSAKRRVSPVAMAMLMKMLKPVIAMMSSKLAAITTVLGDALVDAQALLLQLEHGGHHQPRPHCLQNEAQAQGQGERHVEHC